MTQDVFGNRSAMPHRAVGPSILVGKEQADHFRVLPVKLLMAYIDRSWSVFFFLSVNLSEKSFRVLKGKIV